MSTVTHGLPCSVSDLVAVARRQVAPDLVSDSVWSALRRIPERLPAIAHEGALELRLDGADPRVDLCVCVLGSALARVRLARALADARGSTASTGWRLLGRFAAEWANEASPLASDVDALWLEFDANGTGPPEPFGLLSLAPDRVYRDGRASSGRVLRPLAIALETLGVEADSPTGCAVERFVHELPPFAQVRHAAVRPMGTSSVVRLVVRMPWPELPERLEASGWTGDRVALESLLARLCEGSLVMAANVDIGPDGLGPRVGIEFAHLGSSGRRDRWGRLFDTLEDLGALARELRVGIKGWSGEGVEGRLGSGWLVTRRDLLVKVVHTPFAAPEAKAYLTFGPRLRLDTERDSVVGVAQRA